MQILVLGGTGAMGAHLVSLLDSSNLHDIYVTSRSFHRNYGHISYLMGNAHDIEFLKSIFSDKSYDVVVDFMYYTISEFKGRIDILLGKTTQYVCISSGRVYADEEHPIKETSPRLTEVVSDDEYYDAKEYSQQKCLLEDVLTKSKYQNWTIIRPYITYSENRLQLGAYELKDWFYRIQKNQTLQIARKITDSHTTLTYGYDVARGICAIIGQKKAFGETFHITVDDTITWREVLEIYLDEIYKISGKRIKYIVTSKDIFSSASMNDMQVKYDRCYNRVFDNSKIKQFIDTSTFTKPEVGLRQCIREWLRDSMELKPDWWRQALIDRLTDEHAAIDEFQSPGEYENYCNVLNDRFIAIRQTIYQIKRKIKRILKK